MAGRLNRTEALAELDRLYAALPALECKGRCHDSCTAIDASQLERDRLAERGVHLPEAMAHKQLLRLIATGTTPTCPALSGLGTCTVYDVRPMICRAFGMVLDRRTGRGLMCEHGCVPDGTMHPAELDRVLRDIDELSYQVTGVRRLGRPKL